MDITWYGHSCFRMTERNFGSVVCDPYDYEKIGYEPLKLKADIVTMSNDKPGHSFLPGIKTEPFVINRPGEYEINNIFITGHATNKKGEPRNTIFVCEINGLSFSAAECGFFSDTLLDGNIRSLRLIARGNNETQELLHLSDEQLKNKVSDTGIVYKTESYTKDNASKMAMVTGWAASLDHHQLSFHIIDESGNETL